MQSRDLLPKDKLCSEQRRIINEIKHDHEVNGYKYKRILYCMYFLALVGLFLFIYFSPHFSEEDWAVLKVFPNNLEKIRSTVLVIQKYSEENWTYTYCLFVYMYLSLQSLGIIGCGLLSIISGSIFSFWVAIITVSLCATTGATLCYLLSKSLLRGFVVNFQEKRIAEFSAKIERNKRNILLYFISLRFSPVFPNLFVNLASPIVGVSIKVFYLGTLIGLIPLNIIHIKTGRALDSATQIGADPKDIGFLILMSVAVLIPTFFNKKKNMKEKLKQQQKKADKVEKID